MPIPPAWPESTRASSSLILRLALLTMRKPVYPAGVRKMLASSGTEKVDLYEKEVELITACQISADAKPGPVEIKFRFSYQACNDRLCRARRLLRFPLPSASAARNRHRMGPDGKGS